jgi:hypothetical protein
VLAGGPQLPGGPGREGFGPHRGEHLVGGAQLVSGVTAAALAAQPLSVHEVGAGQVGGDRRPAETADRLGVEVLSLAGAAGGQGAAPGEDAQPPLRPAATS